MLSAEGGLDWTKERGACKGCSQSGRLVEKRVLWASFSNPTSFKNLSVTRLLLLDYLPLSSISRCFSYC